MYINGEKVYKLEFERDIYGGSSIFTNSTCEICGSGCSFQVKVCFDEGEFWDNTEIIGICGDCLINAGFFLDEEDLTRQL